MEDTFLVETDRNNNENQQIIKFMKYLLRNYKNSKLFEIIISLLLIIREYNKEMQ